MTQYRIITLITYVGDRYLQFKSTKKNSKRLWPKFCKVKCEEVECWRFVPTENTYVLRRVDEESCLTSFYNPAFGVGDVSMYMHSFAGHEDYEIGGLTPFVRNYPNIQDYFSELNQKREEYLRKTRAIKDIPTRYL